MKFHTHFYSPHNPSQPSEILMVLPSNYISKSFLSFTTPTRLCLLHDPKAHGRGTLSLIPTPGARQNSWHTGSHPPSTYWLRPAFPLPPKKYGSPLGSVLSSAVISGGGGRESQIHLHTHLDYSKNLPAGLPASTLILLSHLHKATRVAFKMEVRLCHFSTQNPSNSSASQRVFGISYVIYLSSQITICLYFQLLSLISPSNTGLLVVLPLQPITLGLCIGLFLSLGCSFPDK